MKNKTVNAADFSNFLEEHGIHFLTSEADGLGMRVLCDLDNKGSEILSEAFGGVDFHNPPWNNGVASVMLFREFVRPLAIYCLFKDGFEIVVSVNYISEIGGFTADFIAGYENISPEEWLEQKESFAKYYENRWRLYQRSGTAKNGFRNRHALSGREE